MRLRQALTELGAILLITTAVGLAVAGAFAGVLFLLYGGSP